VKHHSPSEAAQLALIKTGLASTAIQIQAGW